MFIVYIIHSQKINKYYTGQTSDLDRRIKDHNRGKNTFSAKGVPWTLVFSKECPSKNDALKLERFIKKRGAARYLNDLNIKAG